MKVPSDEINDDSSPENIKEWDSLHHMELILALEEEFGIQFNDDQITEMLSIKKIVNVVKILV